MERKINLELIISLAVVMATILGSTIPLYLHTSAQSQHQIEAIRQDIKDFHKSMLEFNGRLSRVEEKGNGLDQS